MDHGKREGDGGFFGYRPPDEPMIPLIEALACDIDCDYRKCAQ